MERATLATYPDRCEPTYEGLKGVLEVEEPPSPRSCEPTYEGLKGIFRSP